MNIIHRIRVWLKQRQCKYETINCRCVGFETYCTCDECEENYENFSFV